MNFAFPALLIFILLLPGILLRYNYARGTWGWSSPTSYQRIYEELGFGIAFAFPLHLIAIAVANWLGFRPDVHATLMLLTANYGREDAGFDRAVASLADHLPAVGVYWISLMVGAWAAGHGLHRAVRASGLDLRTKVFRFDNYWYYLLTGESLSFAESPIHTDPIDGVYLSAVVTHGSDSHLYRGIVSDFTFDGSGALDTLVLRDAHRRPLSEDRPSDDDGEQVEANQRYYEVRGDFLILRMSEIRTLNLDYFTLLEVEEDDADL